MSEGVLPEEIRCAEILDWWEEEQERVSLALPERLPALLFDVDRKISEMPVKAFLKKGKFHSDEIEPIVIGWIESCYTEFSQELASSFQESLEEVEGSGSGSGPHSWSYSELATAGAAVAVSAAPIAALPFVGGLFTAGVTVLGVTVVSPALVPATVVVMVSAVALLSAGPGVRGAATEKLKNGFKKSVHEQIRIRVLGSQKEPQIQSLKGTLLSELRNVANARIQRL